MTTTLSASAPPAVTVEDIRDPATVDAAIELIAQDAMMLQSQGMRARRATVRLGAATAVLHVTTARPVRTMTSVNAGAVAFAVFGPRAQGTVNGLPVRPGLLLAVPPETPARLVVAAGWESVTCLLPAAGLDAHLAARHPASAFRVPQGATFLQVGEPQAQVLFDWGKRLVDEAVAAPQRFNEGEDARDAARGELHDILAATLAVASDYQPGRGDRARQAQGLIVKIAEEYALAQVGTKIYVTDLCKAAGVSERTLEYAFKAVAGLTPVAYLARLRLHRARQALLAAAPGTTTVAAEATRWGFTHLGQFARAYRECFGELPSDTLARTADGNPVAGQGS